MIKMKKEFNLSEGWIFKDNDYPDENKIFKQIALGVS